MNTFVFFTPDLLTGGFTKKGQVIKTSKKGVQGYNLYLKGAKNSGVKFKGLNWQQNTGKAFQNNQ